MNAVILGGVAPHIELIRVLKRMGYYTILADYLDNPPAKSHADLFCQISTLDEDAVLELAMEKDAKLVISVCVDYANVTVCRVADRLGLPLPYSLETVRLTTDKGLMKERMRSGGIPTSDWTVLEKGDPVPEDIHFPAVMKPVDNNGSKGVRKVSSLKEAEQYLEKCLSYSRKGRVIIEGFNFGREIQVDCFANKGEAHVLMTREKVAIPRREGMALQSCGSIVPARIPEAVNERIRVIAQRMADAFGFGHTPFFFQANVEGDDIKVIELSPRIGGGFSYKMIKAQTGFDIVEAAANSYFGDLSGLDFQENRGCLMTNSLYAAGGCFDHVIGMDEMLQNGTADDFDLFIAPGTRMGTDMDSRNKVGIYSVSGETYSELFEKLKYVNEHINIVDSSGNSIMCRGLYATE